MDYVIYTYGGGEILWKIFNGLALFFKSDSAYLTGVVKLSLAIGGLWAALQAIYKGSMGILARDYFIPAYLILNILLLPKTSVHIVDEVSSDFKYAKVDNVPLGIAAVTSTASKLSRFMTDRIEQSLKTAEATHFGKTGSMFAARLVSMSRDMRIVDPVIRQNMKDFVRQCFTLPFVWTNILAGKKAALESTDILGLIASHPHQWLGSYWRNWADKGGETTFLSCKDGAAKTREILKAEIPNGLMGLAADLFGNNKMDALKANQKLKTYFEGAWQELSHKAASAHEAAGQEMLMNAYREGVDDKRQEFGLDRLNPHLIAYSSARARLQQNTGFMISSNLFALVGPSLQSTLFGILCVLFVIVVPMTLLPGGLSAFGMWVKLILWVQSWPVFYALINCVSLIIASGKTASLVKTGAGLSLMTQNGLADAAYDAYCYAEGFMCMVPVIAWAVISQSGYALANLASTVTRSMDGLTSKMGSDMVDGNMSFDNQSFHNRNVAGYQMAQQQLAPNFSFGSKYDDGRMNMTYDTHGNPIIQEAQTNLKTNVSGTDSLAASLTESAQAATTAGHTFSKASSEQLNQGLNKLYSYGEQYTQGHGISSRFGTSQDAGESKEWRETMDLAHKFGEQNNISDQKAFQVLAKAGVSAGVVGKILGINAGMDTNTHFDSTDNALLEKAKSSGLGEQFGQHLNSAYKHATGTDGSLSDQSQKNVLDSIQGSFSSAQNYQEQAQAQLSQAETYTKAASIAESSTFSATTNWNDQVLKGVADQMFSGNIAQAAAWQSENPEAYGRHAGQFMTDKQANLIQSLKSDHPLSEEAIHQKFNDVYGSKVHKGVNESDLQTVRDVAEHNRMGLNDRQKMETDFSTLQNETNTALKGTGAKIDGHKGQIQKGYQDQETAFNQRKSDGIVVGGVKNVAHEAMQMGKEITTGFQKVNPPVHDSTVNLSKGVTSSAESSPLTVEKLDSSHGRASGESVSFSTAQHKASDPPSPIDNPRFSGADSKVYPSSVQEGHQREGGILKNEQTMPVSDHSVSSDRPMFRTLTSEGQESPLESYSAVKAEAPYGQDHNPRETTRDRTKQFDVLASGDSFFPPPSQSNGQEVSFKVAEQNDSQPSSVRQELSHQPSVSESVVIKESTAETQTASQPSYAQMEDEISQHHAHNKVAHQEKQIRQLKDSIELAQVMPKEEESLDMSSSQMMER
jgi:conjugal transfer mating pair stabilization protein TraG